GPFTAANLSDYMTCPRKFFLSRFAPRAQQRALGQMRALQQALRSALVDADKLGGPAAAGLERIRDEFNRLFDGSLCADSLEEEQARRRGLRMLAEYVASQRSNPAELLAVDQRFEETIEDFTFVAVADRVERDAELGLIVARYDARRDPPGPTRILRHLPWGLLVMLAEQHYSQRPLARLYALHKNKRYDVTFDDQALGRLRQRVLSIARALRADAEFAPRPGDDCRWCRVRSQCSAWQQRRREALESGGL
ncbi:MAG: PD-(D/E)XK nuclease family protein, partial [Armatimonadetes bacterium]|nr:PD-(D/E)XK nuclease family protein [Armatimonadota bacterium]